MTKEDEELLAGVVTFIRHQHPAFRNRVLDMARLLAADARFYDSFIFDHYDRKPDTDEVYLFFNRLLDMPSPHGDWKSGAFFEAIQSADQTSHTTAAEVIDAIIMTCFYHQKTLLGGGRRAWSHDGFVGVSPGYSSKGNGWQIDS